jgi:uncharacterized protein YgfB (UPF0149 family)
MGKHLKREYLFGWGNKFVLGVGLLGRLWL